MKTSTLIVVAIAGYTLFAYRNSLPSWLFGTPAIAPHINTPMGTSVVSDPGPISNPTNPAQSGYSGSVRDPLEPDPTLTFSAKRSRRASIFSQ